MAAKVNDNSDGKALARIDLTAYDWVGRGVLNPTAKIKVGACGWCHPGGGPAEYARDPGTGLAGTLRYDEAEAGALAQAASGGYLDGDFWTMVGASGPGPSRWAESGVEEVDCLLCHLDYNPPEISDSKLKFYNFAARNKQLTYRNYRWAPTVGARLGSVTGKVYDFDEADKTGYLKGTFTGAVPRVTYSASNPLLSVDAASHLKIKGSVFSRRPAHNYCLFCHEPADTKKRGLEWNAASDVHAAAKLHCLDCHGLTDVLDTDGDPWGDVGSHDIGKGHDRLGSVRNDLDGTMAYTCAGCHADPETQAAHGRAFGAASFHLDRISCEGCHIPKIDWNEGYLINMAAGAQVWVLTDGTTPAWSDDFQKPGTFRPFLKKHDPDGSGPLPEKYYPFGSKSSAWFGSVVEASGRVQPIFLRHVKAAYDGALGKGLLENPTSPVVLAGEEGTYSLATTPQTRASVSTDHDVKVMLEELAARGFPRPVFVAGETRGLDAQGNLAVLHGVEGESSHDFSVNHDVRPALESLGVRGCGDCHGAEGPLMARQVRDVPRYLEERASLVDEDLLDDPAVGVPLWALAGFDEARAAAWQAPRTLADYVPPAEPKVEEKSDGDSGSGSCFVGTLGGMHAWRVGFLAALLGLAVARRRG